MKAKSTIAVLLAAGMAWGQCGTCARYIRTAVKIGGTGAWRDGMVVDSMHVVIDTSTGAVVSGRNGGSFGCIGDRAYVRYDWPDTRANRDSVGALLAMGDIVATRRGRTRALRLDSIAAQQTRTVVARDSVVSAWRGAREAIPPVKHTRRIAPIVSEVVPVLRDRNAIATGTATCGVGGDYDGWTTAFADVANLTGNLTFVQISYIAITAGTAISENLGGYTLTCTIAEDGLWHRGNPTYGHVTDIASVGHGLFFAPAGTGVVVVERLRGIRTVNGSNALRSFVNVASGSSDIVVVVRNCIYDGNGATGSGLYVSAADAICVFTGNVIYDCTGAGLDIDGDDGNSYSIYSNNTMYGQATGIHAHSNSGTFRRNACYANTADYAEVSGAIGQYNASDDATAADGNWTSGTGNLSARDPAVDLMSVMATSADFLRPVYDSLSLSATQTYHYSNYAAVGGRRWSVYGDWIGARAGIDAATWLAAQTAPTNAGGSTKRFPLRFEQYELMAGPDGRFPAPIALDSTIMAACADQDSGRDIYMSNGSEALPRDVATWDTAADEAVVWVRVDTASVDTAGKILWLLCGGSTTPAARDSTVYDSCHTQRADYHLWWHFDERTGTTARDATGHYAGTIIGADTATGMLGACRDFEVSEPPVTRVTNADAGAFAVTQRFTSVVWGNLGTTDNNSTIMGRASYYGNNPGWAFRFSSHVYSYEFTQTLYAVMDWGIGTTNHTDTDAWRHMAMRSDGDASNYAMYHNAVTQSVSIFMTSLTTGSDISTTAPFAVGVMDTLSGPFDGLIDEPRIYLDTLTATQIQTSYAIESGAATGAGVTWGEVQSFSTTSGTRRFRFGFGFGF